MVPPGPAADGYYRGLAARFARGIWAATSPGMPWLLIAILLAELGVLAWLAVMFYPHPPLAYELGWVGTGSMLAMQLYSLRRRVRALRNFGSLRTWLDVHIFLGLQGFVMVAYHGTGVARSASVAALSLAVVGGLVVTGLVGRYLYGWIPRTRERLAGGWQRTLLEVADRAVSRWVLVHRPLAALLLGLTTLHVLAHFAYAV